MMMKKKAIAQKNQNVFTAQKLFAAVALSLSNGNDTVCWGSVDVIRSLLPTQQHTAYNQTCDSLKLALNFTCNTYSSFLKC